MRHRYRSTPFSANIRLEDPDTGYAENLPYMCISTGYTNQFSSYNESESTMDDALTPLGSPRTFNPCIHTRASSAVFSGDFVEYEYPPPTPRLRIYVRQPIRYQPSFITPNVNWGGALDDLAARVDGTIKDQWMVSVSLWEAAQTIAMIRNPFNLLNPGWQHRVSKLPAAALALKRAANVWLESQYGWASMYHDVTDASKALAKAFSSPALPKLEEVAERLSASGRTKEDVPSTFYLNGDEDLWNTLQSDEGMQVMMYEGGMIRFSNVNTHTEWRIGCRHLMSAAIAYSMARKLLSAAALSNWRSIRDTIWEVIPFSFVIDWFVDSRGVWKLLNKERLSQVDISELGWSVKQRTEYTAAYSLGFPKSAYYSYTQWRYSYPTRISRSIAFAGNPGSFTYYERTPGTPPDQDVDSIFLNRGLTRLHCLSGVSLLTQRVLNH